VRKYFTVLAIIVVALAGLTWAGEPREKLDQAIKTYLENVRAEQAKLLEAFDAAIERLRKEGKPDKAFALSAEKKKFVKEHFLAEQETRPAAADEPKDEAFMLKVVTRTGREKNAGTDGMRVLVYINGKEELCFELDQRGVDDFEQGAVNTFEGLLVKLPLKDVRGILLRVEGGDAWKLDRIAFQFSQGDRKSKLYTFKVERWMSAELRDLKGIEGCVQSIPFKIRPEVR
jgi:hypothetical protein